MSKQEIYAYSGKILRIDLTSASIFYEPTIKYAREWLGGSGIGQWILYNEVKPKITPYSPANRIVFGAGPLAGTLAPGSSRLSADSINGLTLGIGSSNCDSHFALELKYAGYDQIICQGKARKPVYIWIDNGNIEIRDASHIWGKTTWETVDLIREELGDDGIHLISIGPAGENVVRTACIIQDKGRALGRCGLGGIMGSKNLKAIAFRGTKGIKVAYPTEFYKMAKKLIKVANGPATAKYRDLGTPSGLTSYNKLGMMPTMNYREGTWEEIDNGAFTGETLNIDWVVKKVACSQCSIACDHIARVPKTHPDYPDLFASVDVEMCYSFGTNTGCSDWPTVFKCIELCDDLGIDAISGGVTASMACELYEVGLITKKDLGYELPFGSTKNLVRFTEEMIMGKGFAGEIFGDGTRQAGIRLEEMGRKNAGYYGMHIKGLEMPAFDLHGMTSFAVGESVSIRGACHLRNGAYGLDAKGTFDRFGYDKPLERGKAIIDVEDIYAIIDSYIICKFTRGIYENDAEMAKVYELVTGIPHTEASINERGAAIVTLSKCFNIREGWTRADDHPPEKFFKDAHTKGPAKGVTLKEDGYQKLLSGYYEARGWDVETGIPTDAILKKFGLDFVIGKLKPASGGKKK